MKFGRKNIFDLIKEGNVNDRTLAGRMKVWMSGKNVSAARRAIRLYDKQPPEKKEAFSQYGLTPEFVDKQRQRFS